MLCVAINPKKAYVIAFHKYKTKTKTNAKCLNDPTCATFVKSRGYKDFKYDIPISQPTDLLSVNQTRPDKTKPDQTRHCLGHCFTIQIQSFA